MGRKRTRKQKGGALYRRRPTLTDKIAEGVAMGLSGPTPSFLKLGALLAKQAAKGVSDNVRHYQRGRGLAPILSHAATIGFALGRYKRKGVKRV